MEERNLDLGIPLTREQWEELGHTAQAIHSLGYDWTGDDPDRIHVRLRDEEARGLWERLVTDEGGYGAHDVEIAQYVFNDGRPYAHLEAIPSFDEPAINSQEEEVVEIGQERFARERWHQLLERSGIHFERGHVSPEAG